MGLVLDFDDDGPLRTHARRWRNRIDYVVASDAKDRLGLAAMLVRPDGFVAWASDVAPYPCLFGQAALRWFGEPCEVVHGDVAAPARRLQPS